MMYPDRIEHDGMHEIHIRDSLSTLTSTREVQLGGGATYTSTGLHLT